MRKVYLAKMNNLPKHHGAGPPEVRGPVQLHCLHRLKAGPGCSGERVGASLAIFPHLFHVLLQNEFEAVSKWLVFLVHSHTFLLALHPWIHGQ